MPGKRGTILHKIASQRTWLMNFGCRNIVVTGVNDLTLSDETIDMIDSINGKIELVRDSIDRDWDKQRTTIKADNAR